MKDQNNRRTALKHMAGGAAVFASAMLLPESLKAADHKATKLKGRIKHSVCKWCYKDIPLEELCKAAKGIGLSSIELLGPDEWPMLKKYGLTCAMAWGAEKSLTEGFNDPQYHDELVARYEAMIPKVANAGLDNLICFSGNRNGMSDEEGMKNCAKGLKRLMGTAEKHKVTLSMELLNSKVNHKDYMCDHTKWGVDLVKMVGSDRFRLLYDIYHMQIMEGDVIRTIQEYHPYISHYHTGGVPGRNEIDNTQELYYPAIMQAILDTGFKGYVAQEFIPKSAEPLTSLRNSIVICDV
ncbi:TIM barrel protein [Pontibacter sp. E15-1]|uniref:hydroxypyruvate isomerase family protein n=1 Tax=Pontibacter sp. E15-1 TaxID=2919918 RepID=UPI001F4F736D|nr:TIM barrel protein [Pontibacter sp. E15-1]MCJ8167184.1 TIM barrel protein [Pontibacter sp. E15-1]